MSQTQTTPVDMTAILGKRLEDIKDPPQLAPGTYLFRVDGWRKPDRLTQAGNPQIEFACAALQALDGVDPSMMEGVELPTNINYNFIITEKSLYRLRDFLKNTLGIPATDSLEDALNESPGRVFRGNVTHRAGQGTAAGRFFPNISETFPAD